MILTPLDFDAVPAALARFEAGLDDAPYAGTIFRRIASSWTRVAGRSLALSVDPAFHLQAVSLCRRFGMETVDEPPRQSFTWDGRAVRVDMEPSVIIHEVAHLQCASPSRRTVYDFGLGAGPETGKREIADADARVFGVERDQEEALASLLGILWEEALGQPAVLAFLEQNWLEGNDTGRNRHHFIKNVELLRRHGLIDARGLPTETLRTEEDGCTFFKPVPPDDLGKRR